MGVPYSPTEGGLPEGLERVGKRGQKHSAIMMFLADIQQGLPLVQNKKSFFSGNIWKYSEW